MKLKQILFAVIFLTLIFLMPVLFLINQNFVLDGKNSTEMFEKRSPTSLPNPLHTSVSRWPAAMEEFFRDHLPFRHFIIGLNSDINKQLFNSTTSTQIMIGQQDWLFLKDTEEIKNVSDFQGIVPISEQQLENYYNNINSFAKQQALENRKTVLFVVPNKEQIYGHYMPVGINKIDQQSRTDKLIDYINQQETSEIIVANPKNMLLEQSVQNDRLYYKYDTHWTAEGCYIGIESLLLSLGVDISPYNSNDFYFSGEYFSGDIGALGALFNLESEQVFVKNYQQDIEIVQTVDEFNPQVKIYNSGAINQQKVLFLGDSFRYEVEKQLPYYFADIQFADFETSNINSIIEQYDPDIIVIQQVERNIENFGIKLVN